MQKPTNIGSLVFLTLSAILLVALQIKPFGWVVLFLGAAWTLLLTEKKFWKDIILLYIAIGILSITPISTDIGTTHFLIMTLGLASCLLIPYGVSHLIYKDHYLSPKFNVKRMFHKKEMIFLFLLLLIVYVLFPFMFRVTGAYENWTVKPDALYLTQFFIGLNLVGVWDELFFITLALKLFRRHFPFVIANIGQMILFTSFLFKLGFGGWSFLAIMIFATFQGLMYRKTESLLYLITIHLSADFILFLVLIYLHYPTMMPIFLIK